jgi:hypothetical protein
MASSRKLAIRPGMVQQLFLPKTHHKNIQGCQSQTKRFTCAEILKALGSGMDGATK